MNRQTHVRHAAPGAVWVVVLLGIWVAISPFVLNGPMWNNLALGAVVVVLALISGYAWSGALPLMVVASIWLFVSTFAMDFSSMAFLWNNVLAAFAISAAAAVSEQLRLMHSTADQHHPTEG